MRSWGWIGIGVFAAGVLVLVRDVPGLNTAWFLFGWVGWLVFVDGVIAGRQGHSFLAGRRRELAAMMVASVAFWTLFEFANLRLANWYYVFLPRSDVWQALFAGLAFATVLPACFVHAELLAAWGAWERTRCRPLAVGRGLEGALLAFGLACLVCPLLWPRPCFWMIWGAPLGVPLVLNRRSGAPSLLADLEAGDPRRLLRLLGGGVIAGGLWEGLNFPARAKWIYTVPGLESHKLFEMPWLGFVGFPVLAVASFEAYSLWCHHARSGRSWERPDAAQPSIGKRGRRVMMAALVAFSALATAMPLDPAVQARRPLLGELAALEPQQVAALREAGVRTPEQLVARDAALVDELVGPATAQAARQEADLMLHKGMGADGARWLASVGITSIDQLAAADPGELEAALLTSPPPGRPITAPQVRVWVRAADGGRSRR